jgi:hypothetical protein
VGALEALHRSPFSFNGIVIFGFYCLLLGYLIFRSRFLPRWLGHLVALAGLGWRREAGGARTFPTEGDMRHRNRFRFANPATVSPFPAPLLRPLSGHGKR